MFGIEYEHGKMGLIYASSPDLRGLLISRPTMEELREAIPQAITDMYLACGEKVLVSSLKPDELLEDDRWVAFPAEIAKRAQEREAAI